jgi:hypothetical protein
MRKGWFGPKRFGWGVSPRSWEGWLAMLAWVIGLVALLRQAGPALDGAAGLSADAWRGVLVVGWTGALLALGALTYDKDA